MEVVEDWNGWNHALHSEPDHEYAQACARSLYNWLEPGLILQGPQVRAAYKGKAATRGYGLVDRYYWEKYLTAAGFVRRNQVGHVTWTKPDR